jgi:hypothetical protein
VPKKKAGILLLDAMMGIAPARVKGQEQRSNVLQSNNDELDVKIIGPIDPEKWDE